MMAVPLSTTLVSPESRLSGWHTYRVEAKGDTIRFLIDGILITEMSGAERGTITDGGRIGIVSSVALASVRSFRVLSIEGQ